MTEDPLQRHEGCGGALRRRVYPAGIVFKGPGFHVNDYGPKRNANGADSKGKSNDSSKSAETKADTKPAETSAKA